MLTFEKTTFVQFVVVALKALPTFSAYFVDLLLELSLYIMMVKWEEHGCN